MERGSLRHSPQVSPSARPRCTGCPCCPASQPLLVCPHFPGPPLFSQECLLSSVSRFSWRLASCGSTSGRPLPSQQHSLQNLIALRVFSEGCRSWGRARRCCAVGGSGQGGAWPAERVLVARKPLSFLSCRGRCQLLPSQLLPGGRRLPHWGRSPFTLFLLQPAPAGHGEKLPALPVGSRGSRAVQHSAVPLV